MIEFPREREYYLVNMDNKSQIQFISPKDQQLDGAVLKDKYGPFWKLVQRNGAVRDLRTETGLEDLRKDLTSLYDEILNIAQEKGVEITEEILFFVQA